MVPIAHRSKWYARGLWSVAGPPFAGKSMFTIRSSLARIPIPLTADL
jgi:hypothetical protein